MSFLPGADSLCEEKRQKQQHNIEPDVADFFFRNIPRGRKMIWSVSEALFDAHCSFPEL